MTMTEDAVWMDRALALAERGRGRTTPNPIVGAVIVTDGGVVVGQGAHLEAGGPHAEIHALQMAGPRARGAVLYCTLEPCSHTGRTGPCAEQIARAGIRRVVVATTDPNPLVSGAGLAYLRERGIEVREGVGRETARRQNAPFFTWMTKNRPFVTLKIAVSRDGFVGRSDGRVKLTSQTADRFFHRQRAEVDAIAVGAGTVLVDDPLLTARGAYRQRPLTRVIFDWRARLSADARVFSTLEAGPVIMFVCAAAAEERRAALEALESSGVVVERRTDRSLPAVLADLARRDVLSLLVEGGPHLHAAFCQAGVVDRMQWIVTPRELRSGVPLGADVGHGLTWTTPPRVTMLGPDVAVELDVHRTD